MRKRGEKEEEIIEEEEEIGEEEEISEDAEEDEWEKPPPIPISKFLEMLNPDNENIYLPFHRIWLYKTKEGKKMPLGENSAYTRDNILQRMKQDWEPEREALRQSHGKRDGALFKAFSLALKHSRFFVIDVDDESIHSMEEFVEKTEVYDFKDCPWTVGNTKGIHIFIFLTGDVLPLAAPMEWTSSNPSTATFSTLNTTYRSALTRSSITIRTSNLALSTNTK